MKNLKMVMAYHGTGLNELESILQDRAVYSFSGDTFKNSSSKVIRKY
jgi:chaperonin cofactor prefoldin